jgi:hypothetical protein
MKNEDIVPIQIDLSKPEMMNESLLFAFGTAIKLILKQMFGQDVFLPVAITGTTSQIESFAKALAGEKKYFQSYVQHGLNDPRTHEDKYRLNLAVSKFERDTGIKWPYK